MAPLVIRCVLLAIWITMAAAEAPPPCVIPPGMYDEFPVSAYNHEPKNGKMCKFNVTTPVQRIVNHCTTRWCCADNCNCNTTNLQLSNVNITCREQPCYLIERIFTDYEYQCCPGYYENNDLDRICIPYDLCTDNYLGCEYNCSTSNNISTCTCPIGYEPNPLNNKTCRSIVSVSDVPVVAPVVDATTPAADGSSFPYQYVIAIVVGSTLLLLLLLLIVLCCVCRRRKETPVDVFFVGKEIDDTKKVEVDPYDISYIGDDEKKKPSDKESDYATIDLGTPGTSSGSSSTAAPTSRRLDDRGDRAKPNIYSSLSKIPAPRQVSDLNSDYAEIVDSPSSAL